MKKCFYTIKNNFSSGIYMDYNCLLFLKCKKGLIKTLLFRSYNIKYRALSIGNQYGRKIFSHLFILINLLQVSIQTGSYLHTIKSLCNISPQGTK